MPEVEFIADTSAMVRLLRGDPAVETLVAGKTFATSFVTLAELNVGVLKARDAERATEQVERVLSGVEIILATDATAWIYATLYRDLERLGSLIPINDIWIAAMAIELRLPLLARDAHFSRIPALTVFPC